MNSIYIESGDVPFASKTTVILSPPSTFKCLVFPISLNGLGGKNSVFGCDHRYNDETEWRHVNAIAKKVTNKLTRVIFFHILIL